MTDPKDPKTSPDKMTDKTADKSGRGRMKSQKLDRTLQELEAAFGDWETLSSAALKSAARSEKPAKELTQSEKEFKKKTKKLLVQLRQQLSEL